MIKIFDKMPLDELLEVIQNSLADRIDYFYDQAKELIGTEKQDNLGFLKEKLKGQIEVDLKLIVQNIILKISIPSFRLNIDYVVKELKKAIK